MPEVKIEIPDDGNSTAMSSAKEEGRFEKSNQGSTSKYFHFNEV